MKTAIKVQDNLKEILTFLEEKGYKWSTGSYPTEGTDWGSKYIIIDGKTLFHRTCGVEPGSISFELFKTNLAIMKTNRIIPGYKLVLENGNSFIVKEYKNTKIIFPEGSSRSVMTLDDLCDENLHPRNDMSPIVKVLNSLNIPIWERKFTRSKIKSGYTMTNENGNTYLVVVSNCTLRIMSTTHYVVGSKLYDIMNEDMSAIDSDHAAIVEVRDTEGKVVYKKE